MAAGRGATVRPAPDDHDGAVESPAFGQDRDKNPGHAFEERRAARDPHARLTEVE